MFVKSEARKNLPGFQILMFCNCVLILVFILFSQNDIELTEPGRVMYMTLTEGGCLSQADLSTFRFDVLYLLNTFSWNSRESRSTDGFKFCQYAFVIYSKLCVDPSTHKTSIWILLSAIHFYFLLVLIIWC